MKRKNIGKWRYHGEGWDGVRFWSKVLRGGEYMLGVGWCDGEYRWTLVRPADNRMCGRGQLDVETPVEAQRLALQHSEHVMEAQAYGHELRRSGFNNEEITEILEQRWPTMRMILRSDYEKEEHEKVEVPPALRLTPELLDELLQHAVVIKIGPDDD